MHRMLACTGLALVLLAGTAQAQMHAGLSLGTTPASTGNLGSGASGMALGGFAANRGFPVAPVVFFSDYPYQIVPQQLPPQVIVIQQPSTPAAPVQEKTITPLVLERQGDRFVRVDEPHSALAMANAVLPSQPGAERPKVAETPAVILVFRDGSREEIQHYTVMDSVIYEHADYWTQGRWTKKVLISDLDVPSTLKLNRERGAKFMLPSGPGEIVVAP